ncbi:LLM class flavin-dependent oxidoreductase [Streptomyces sp. Inha503]|uniref:LLM class flavin-dependent oxidoreductase n=1 Tax=Streptomyces sp. Inha503 TaxID=3383314 RepID=UPI0039A31EE5
MTARERPPRLGVVSPVVLRVPGAHSPWEATAGVAELATVAQAADELGYDHLTCSEHVAVPVEVAKRRGGTYWDPLSTFGYLAARTHRLLGAEFVERGTRADDALAALRASLSRAEPEYHGSHYDYSGLLVEPHAVQPRLPLWIGGSTRRSLRRALELGDGWAPFDLSFAQLSGLLDGAEPPDGFEMVLSPARPLDPACDPEGAARLLRQARKAGATIVGVRVAADSADHYCAQLEHLAQVAEAVGP